MIPKNDMHTIGLFVFSGCLVGLFVWAIIGITDSMQKIEVVISRQMDGYKIVDEIKKKIDSLDNRIRILETSKK